MKQKIKTVPDISSSSPKHQEAIKRGMEYYGSWLYNVVDKYKSLSKEEIKADLKATSFPYAVLFEHLIGDFNMGTGIRNANAFNAREVFYLGDKRWDKRSATGVFNYTDVKFLPTIDDLLLLQKDYQFIGIDNTPGSTPMSDHVWEENTLLIFGEESVGLTPFMQSLCKKTIYISQYGSVRSLNVGTASGIVMHDFVSKFRNK